MVPAIFETPPAPLNLVGRDRELSWLERNAELGGFGQPEPLAVVGPAGIGKTALVSFYCHSHRKPRWRESEQEVVWIPCSAFRERRGAFTEFMRSDSLGEARMWPLDRITVVLDGADEIKPHEISEAIGHVVNYKRVGSVILTSRNTSFGDTEHWATRRMRTLDLGPLTFEAAESFLTQLGSFDEKERFALLDAARGSPLTVTLLARLAAQLRPAEFRRVLSGDIYKLPAFPADPEPELIKIVQPTIVSASAAMVEKLKKQPDGILSLGPRQFEELITELLRDMGWDVELTPATRDGGKDILAYLKTDVGKMLCLVEAKRYRKDRKIGVELVRTLYGTLCDYQANSAMMVTTSTFSKDARMFEKKHEFQLGLKDYTDVAGWIMKHGRKAPALKR
jgi:hypothetical protein